MAEVAVPGGEPARTGSDVLAWLGGHPGGPELLAAAATADLSLVGGAVRDLLLGATPRELDVVAGPGADVQRLASELADRLGAATPTVHERFGTAVLEWPGGRIDLARRRAEAYPHPGALPVVREGSEQEDLLRRDFTVNALAVGLGGDRAGELHGAPDALGDLRAQRLRVIHDASFADDPTRLLRLARYRARLGFEIDPHTAGLAAEALAAGALETVSGGRVGAELRLALAEPDPLAALQALDDLGVLAAIDPALQLHAQLAARVLALLPADARTEVALLASLLRRDGTVDARPLLDRLEFGAGVRDAAVVAATGAGELGGAMAAAAGQPSQLHAALAGRAPEAIALAAAAEDDAGAEAAARDWLDRLRHVRLQINGDDLLAAGVPAGPDVGTRLDRALRLRLDGELAAGREAELRAALEPGA